MHEIYELKEQLLKELEEYGRKGELSTGSLEVVDKLAHTVKNLCKIIEEAEMEEEGYSMAGGGYRRSYARGGNQGGGGNTGGGSSNRSGRSYEGGSRRSYARGRNARRDSMGRYSSEGGYSYGNDEMIDQLNDLMEEAPEQVKSDIQRLISKVENM